MRDEIKKAVEALSRGGLILYPTETVWGLGCDATNAVAVENLLALKGRGVEKGLIVLVDSDVRLERHVKAIPDVAWDLIDNSTKPLTIIYDAAIGLADNVAAPDGSVAIRITSDPFCKELIRAFRKPIVSTSANSTGKTHVDSFDSIEQSILDGVDYVVNLKRHERLAGKPSSVVKLATNGEIRIIRE